MHPFATLSGKRYTARRPGAAPDIGGIGRNLGRRMSDRLCGTVQNDASGYSITVYNNRSPSICDEMHRFATPRRRAARGRFDPTRQNQRQAVHPRSRANVGKTGDMRSADRRDRESGAKRWTTMVPRHLRRARRRNSNRMHHFATRPQVCCTPAMPQRPTSLLAPRLGDSHGWTLRTATSLWGAPTSLGGPTLIWGGGSADRADPWGNGTLNSAGLRPMPAEQVESRGVHTGCNFTHAQRPRPSGRPHSPPKSLAGRRFRRGTAAFTEPLAVSFRSAPRHVLVLTTAPVT
jgi:hypothetical protein